MLKAKKALSIVLNITANKRSYDLGDQNALRGKNILTIIPFTAGMANTTAEDPAGTLIANGIAETGYLSLQNRAGENIYDSVPLKVLDPSTNGSGYPIIIETREIDWQKSKVVIDPDIAGNVGKSIVLTVFYED